MLVCDTMFGDMKRRMTVADAQSVNIAEAHSDSRNPTGAFAA